MVAMEIELSRRDGDKEEFLQSSGDFLFWSGEGIPNGASPRTAKEINRSEKFLLVQTGLSPGSDV
jgi:hypothetical protein